MNKPIGVIDSGVGGLTVAREMMRQLPKEEIYYVGDTARCPYGPRPLAEVKTYTMEMIQFLMTKGIKMLVIACNTATAAILEEVKQTLDIPVIGVIHPGARSALKVTNNLEIGIIGTIGTVKSKAYEVALKEIQQDVSVHSLACPPFVPLVENGEWTGATTRAVVETTLAPLKETPIDTLILGCTHYPLLRSVIAEVMGEGVELICSGAETAREVSVILDHSELLYTGERMPLHRYYSTASNGNFKEIANQWMEVPVEDVEHISLGEL
ncbi:glutamate racemase [Fictibacillus macauensis ZFHKF-1]|uniref:Glutamate racemase n=1 Tax=Fictibacillus macauensis ZFHKF-1 TaxID=1196324 RepID=I8AIT0_9BACL|nr:glutamate racemase [Fictibacillus macauensis]EIT85394.1 glutamate racemase [Fictibacillus macauensis ZFHKF-1]